MTSGILPLEGCKLAWWQKGEGTPVLFVHGTAAGTWGDFIDRTSTFARPIWYDRRAFGASKGKPLPDLPRHTNDAAALLQAQEVRGAVIVGWSMGGIIAVALAVRYPDLVSRLVLLEPPFWAGKHLDLSLINGVGMSIALGLLAGPARGGRRFSRWAFAERDGSNSLDKVDADVRDQTFANARPIGIEIRAGTGEHLSRDEVTALRIPTIVFAGNRGRPFLEAGARRIAALIPGADFQMLEGASHFLQIERSALIADAIRRHPSR